MEQEVASSPPAVQEENPIPSTEPPWTGWIETTGDALLILEAARRGMIPRVTRRLVDSERKMITSGSVFVFDEDESGIKRWTDGFYWSPSRILGNFLLYRETDKKSNLRGPQRSQAPTSTSPSILVNEGSSSNRNESSTLSRPKNADLDDADRARERSLFGSLTNSKKFKSEGMMKKTFSLSIGGVSQHLISYYKVEDIKQGRLRTPSSLPELASLEISAEYLNKTHFRVPPRVEYDADGIPRYRGEADDPDSPSLGESGLSEGTNNKKRSQKRFEPYGDNSSKPHRARSYRGDNSTSGRGDQGGQSGEADSPLSSPTTPPSSTGGFDSGSYVGYNGIQGFPGSAGNYYPIASFYPGGHASSAIAFHGPFSLAINGGSNNNADNAHPTSTYPSAPALYAPPLAHHIYAPNGTPAVNLPGTAIGMVHHYPAAGTWRHPIGTTTDKAEDSQKSTEAAD
ncbi:hypothetical protein Clacol_008390 [Clathrus columnatus]|uniref:Uncharacterized protein n=1 Tax=Clathrus columnatus TaxID=1419009 RepID=A0AAV5AKW4_9AGAM|nr:hypothetical protein Clacol_008390 [Clathrus columnatus]